MSIATELARTITRTTHDQLPALALDHARMIIASTLASAAAGRNIRSAAVVRALVRKEFTGVVHQLVATLDSIQ